MTAPESESAATSPAASTARSGVSADSDEWRRRGPTTEELHHDMLIALALFCGAVLSLTLGRGLGFYEDPAGPVVSVLCLALLHLPVAWRRRRPAVVAVVVAGAMILSGELRVPELLISNISIFLVLYTLGAWRARDRAARIARWTVVAAMAAWLLVSFIRISVEPMFDSDEPLAPGALTPALAMILYQLLTNVLFFAGAIWFGHRAWESARDRARAEERAEQLRAERALVAQQTIALERLRLARELHDSVAHHVSLMGIQASAARTVLPTDPGEAERCIRRVEDAARRSVAELHHLLGVLRTHDQDAVTSTLRAEHIPDLMEQLRSAGIAVDHQVHGDPRPLEPLASLTLYRVAQESLTNVRKHAGPSAQASLRIRWRGASVELEVTDDGGGPAAQRPAGARTPSRPAGGHGLQGMRERAAAAGGRLETGPSPEGGFMVRVELPLDVAAASTAAGTADSPDSGTEPALAFEERL
ncbi:sensor histidine kinase [Nesterenkonia sp. HG001]|uniref:sensor histidine kinase n=1 Tax=Nesterenkonia sp. HG001 TaxID=2983207 RepID=UPI002AC3BA8C|nr:sensor histidine kinase [Nesterenkonia sp. HG001]MDZ5077673.1 sensor histidine kinase [Nesterenkonia sp. HG001]